MSKASSIRVWATDATRLARAIAPQNTSKCIGLQLKDKATRYSVGYLGPKACCLALLAKEIAEMVVTKPLKNMGES